MKYDSGYPMIDAAMMSLFIVLRDWTNWLAKEFAWILVVLLVCAVVFRESPLSRDDTDAGQGWFDKRSSMQPLTDHKTGCQYLMGEQGGLTPRLTYDGKHMGCNQLNQLKGNN